MWMSDLPWVLENIDFRLVVGVVENVDVGVRIVRNVDVRHVSS